MECYRPSKRHLRKPTWTEANIEGRWRSFGYEDLMKRDKVNLDIFWLRDKSLEDSDDLPTPDVLAQEIADDLVRLLVQRAAALVCGDPMDPETDVGTVITEKAAMLFERRVEDAVAHGAERLYGEERRGALFPPTVVDRVPYDCELVREETFGPVIPVIRCKGIDDVIRVSNSTAFGLSSGVCTNRLDYITRFIDELAVGTVNVWEVPGYRIEMSPFGGIKDSGLGYKEGVLEAMKSYTNVKTYSLPWV